MSDTINNNAEAIKLLLEVGRQREPLIKVEGAENTYCIGPGFTMQDCSRFFPPTRIKAAVMVSDPGSFAEYFNRFKDANSVIFASVGDTAEFVGVLDYHIPATTKGNVPRYCSHKVQFQPDYTEEWADLVEMNGSNMNQESFANWLEENQALIVQPPGAELLELVQNLEGHKNARFNTAIRLQNGKNSINYDEDVMLRGAGTTGTTNGSIEIPAIIKFGVAPYEGTERVAVSARIKYRIDGRVVNFRYEIIGPKLVERDALQAMFKTISEKTATVPFLGQVVNQVP